MSRTHYTMSEGAFDGGTTLLDVVENRVANERYFRPDWSPKGKTTKQIAEELWPDDLATGYNDLEFPAEWVHQKLDRVLCRDLAYHIQVLEAVSQALPRDRGQHYALLNHARDILATGIESTQQEMRRWVRARWSNLLEEQPMVHAKVWLNGVLDEEPHNDPPIEGLRELAREKVLSRREAQRLINELAKHVEED
jgi:hypothetical protein